MEEGDNGAAGGEARIEGNANTGGDFVGGKQNKLEVNGGITGGVVVVGDNNIIQSPVIRRCESPMPTQRQAFRPQNFTGRGALVEDIKQELLESPGGPAIVLSGMGGIGKSTLARQAACIEEVEKHFPDGTFWVDLQETDAVSALDHIACAFGYDISAITDLAARSRTVWSHLQGKRLLLVLDNAWEIAEVRPLLPPYGSACCAIVTTRDEELANAISERVISLAPLGDEEGAQFLVQVVGKAAAGAEAPAYCLDLTRLLGGLPLALELAGKLIRKEARNAWFTWSSVIENLRDQQARLDLSLADQSVRATFLASYARALDESDRQVFSWLGLLAPEDLLLDAVARVAGLAKDAAAPALSRLVDLSLLQQAGPHTYRIHPLLHDFAREQSATFSEELRREGFARASDYFYELAGQLGRSPASMDEIRPVLRSHHYAAAARDHERAKRVYPWYGDVAVPGFLIQNGYSLTLLRLCEAELSMADTGPQVAYAAHQLGQLESDLGRYADAIRHLRVSLDLYRKEGFDLMVSKLSYILAQAHQAAGDCQPAIAAFLEAIAVDRKIENTAGESLALVHIGDCYLSMGDAPGAVEYYRQACALAENHGDHREQAIVLIRLAGLYLPADPSLAGEYLDRALALKAYQGWDGARLLIQMGNLYNNLLYNQPEALDNTAACFIWAYTLAQGDNSPLYESVALYYLGNLFEHLFLVPGRETDFAGALACYELADQLAQGMELPPYINPRERIEARLRPRLDPADFDSITQSALPDLRLAVQAALRRLIGAG